ncbi:MAG TPA: HAD-IIIA family hydrolase [Burkholderiales bacterium]|nr:HAD-IIIA family hydrolase [Burkholderiales bacterium]
MSSGPVVRGDRHAVLFDLDGTLADTAPDLGYALNALLRARDLPELPVSLLRAHASSGARGLLNVGFGIDPGDPGFERLREEFLDTYEKNLSRASALFPRMPELLERIEAHGVRWGIVTNKAKRFTHPLVRALRLEDRAACVVCGDSTPFAKPHPAPMLEALSRLGLDAGQCIYVGDDERDVQAAHAAGMPAVVVRYGYLGNGRPPEEWGADLLVNSPDELGSWLFGAVPSGRMLAGSG